MNRPARTALVKRLALRAGFDRVGIAAAHPRPDDEAGLRAWLAAGRNGEMGWLGRDPGRRCDPGAVVAGAQSVICLALDYDSEAPRSAEVLGRADGRGWISRYAWGDDYHLVAERCLKAFARAVEAELAPRLGPGFRGPGGGTGPWRSAADFRYYVDHGPVLERPWAEEAGLGWRGRHGLLVAPERGSFFFLAVVITSVSLHPDTPVPDHCGSCTACVDACPSEAITPERSVDARRCISYLTIEAPIATATAHPERLHRHLFGCDICQDVCPFNRFSRPAPHPDFAPRPGCVGPELAALTSSDDDALRRRFRRSAVRRRKPPELRALARALTESMRSPTPSTGSDGSAPGTPRPARTGHARRRRLDGE